jgi:hypothetical protein
LAGSLLRRPDLWLRGLSNGLTTGLLGLPFPRQQFMQSAT